MVRRLIVKKLSYILFLICTVTICTASPVLSQDKKIPVILTLDVEKEEDSVALRKLKLDVPATYFITGEFAEQNQNIVKELIQDNTIGSHSYSHPKLTGLDSSELRKDLLMGKLILEKVTGKELLWFRAPYLEYNYEAMIMLKEMGFLYDSSDAQRWQRQTVLKELPISDGPDGEFIMAGDYNIFLQSKMTSSEGLEWLKQLYFWKANTGQPLVILLHPHIIVQYADTLKQFIRFVETAGGVFMSADDYVGTYHSKSSKNSGIWIDFSLGFHDPVQTAKDINEMGFTDVFLMASDPEGNQYYISDNDNNSNRRDLFGETLNLLKQENIRVHAWIPIFRNPHVLQAHPDWGIIAQDGTRSSEWLSPENIEVQAFILNNIKYMIKNYDIDGIHMDYLRYPDFIYDFAPHAVDSFKKAYSLDSNTRKENIVTDYYNQWMNWRVEQIVHFTQLVREEINRLAGSELTLSAALIAEAANSYRAMEKFGQDYSKLARHLDIVISMAYFKEEYKPISWISNVLFASRTKIGNKPLFTGISAYQKPGGWTYNLSEFSKVLNMASSGSDGIVIYPYLYLFRRGETAWNMPEGSMSLLQNVISHKLNHTTNNVLEKIGLKKENFQIILIIFAVVSFTTLAIIIRRRFTRRDAIKPELHSSIENSVNISEWRKIKADIGSGAVNGLLSEKISNFLRIFNAKKIERFRIAYILDILTTSSDPLSSFLNGAFNFIPGWRTLGFRFLEEASLLGYARVDDKTASITDDGRQELELAKKDGYDRDLWIFIENRIHESLVATCPICGKNNITHWYWHTFDCSSCGKKIFLKQCSHIICKPPKIAARFYTPV